MDTFADCLNLKTLVQRLMVFHSAGDAGASAIPVSKRTIFETRRGQGMAKSAHFPVTGLLRAEPLSRRAVQVHFPSSVTCPKTGPYRAWFACSVPHQSGYDTSSAKNELPGVRWHLRSELIGKGARHYQSDNIGNAECWPFGDTPFALHVEIVQVVFCKVRDATC